LIRAEKITSLLLILLAVFIGFESRKYPLGTIDNPGPGFLPLLLGVAMAVMAIALTVRAWKNGTDEVHRPFWPEKGGLSKVSLTFVVILLFTALLEITGYMMNIFFLFLILLRPIGRQRWIWSISISMGATLVSYLLFDKWLMIPLPRGIWFGN
jgi:cellulose synthase/poly-beta-1,6-N-acetylglucosamine synthase-like glycosyltransferase